MRYPANSPHSVPEGHDSWKDYWASHGQPWRVEQEIDAARKDHLQQRLASGSESYPFAGFNLGRADIEWMLSRHGPVSWDDLAPPARIGLDIRGADLRGVDLSELPLTRLRAGLTEEEWKDSRKHKRKAPTTILEGARLRGAQLQGAILDRVDLKGADLGEIKATEISLYKADLRDVDLFRANLTRANMRGTRLEGADFHETNATNAVLQLASFGKETRLNEACLSRVALDQAIFDQVSLGVVNWNRVRNLGDEFIARERGTRGSLHVRDGAVWVDPPRRKSQAQRAADYESAARAYRTLSLALRSQGLSRFATHFHYCSEVMDRKSRFHRALQALFSKSFLLGPPRLLPWLMSMMLGILTGYGDRLRRLLFTYIVVVTGFAAMYLITACQALTLNATRNAFVLSVTALHGRGLAPPSLPWSDTMAALGGIEAMCGVLIEGLFVASLVRRVTRS